MRKFILTNILYFIFFTSLCYGQRAIVKIIKNYTIDNPEKIAIKDLEEDIDRVLLMPKSLAVEKKYNSSGKIIKRISYQNGKVDHVATYKYNDSGKRTEWTGESNSFKFKWIYFYDSQGRNYKDIKFHGNRLFQRYEYEFEGDNIITKRYFDSAGKNFWTNYFTYDSKGRKTSYKMTHIIKDQEEYAKYKYDNNDNLLTQEMYDYSGVLKWRDSNIYDKNNNKIETARYDENNELVEKAYLKYNSNNDLIEIESYNKDNILVDHIRYIRKYDNKGNQIIKVYIKDNSIKTIDINKIEYY